MARIPKCRRVEFYPAVKSFKPAGVPRHCLERVTLRVEEIEALRLKDQLGLEQEECAQKMRVSRPTFQRILVEAHAKVADALINGKEIFIDGGDYCLGPANCRRAARGRSASSCLFGEEEGSLLAEEKGGKQEMREKIAICAAGDTPASPVDGRFGRCAFFMVWDPEKEEFITLRNAGPEAEHGAGTGAAQTLLQHGVGTVVASRIGPKAWAVLNRAEIKIVQSPEGNDVDTALKRLQSGDLDPLDAPNNK